MMLRILAASSLLLVAPAAAQTRSGADPNNTSSYTNYSNSGPGDWERQRDLATMAPQRQSGNPPQVSEAKRLAKGMNIPCEVSDAALLGRAKGKDGVQSTTYEIACKDDFGWIITSRSDGQNTAFDCLALMTSAKAMGKGWNNNAVCLLGANASSLPGLRKLAKQMTSPCTVEQGAYMGQGGDPPIARYEMLCKEGGYIIDSPTPGSKASFQSFPCGDAAAAGLACSLKHKAG